MIIAWTCMCGWKCYFIQLNNSGHQQTQLCPTLNEHNREQEHPFSGIMPLIKLYANMRSWTTFTLKLWLDLFTIKLWQSNLNLYFPPPSPFFHSFYISLFPFNSTTICHFWTYRSICMSLLCLMKLTTWFMVTIVNKKCNACCKLFWPLTVISLDWVVLNMLYWILQSC